MTLTRLALSGLRYYWRTHAAVAGGVASAVAVIAGALLVGHSVRASLLAITTARLGQTEVAIAADRPVMDTLGDRLVAALKTATPPSASARAVPLLTLTGTAMHESSGRRANDVAVYGVDARFFEFHGVPATALSGTESWLSPDLASELRGAKGDAIVVRVARPTDIPADSLHGRRENAGKSLRLTLAGTLARDGMGAFSLAPTQGPVRAVFVSLDKLQRDLDLAQRANLFLVSGATSVRDALPRLLTSDDLGLRWGLTPTVLIETTSGLIPDSVAAAITAGASAQNLTSTPVFTWLANRMTVAGRTTPYSLVTAIGANAAGDKTLAGWLADAPTPPIVLNDWAARDLHAAPGDALELEYYRWADAGQLVTDHASFRVAGVLPMTGLALDRHLAPPYPGITEANGLSDWDPPFPIDLKLVRPIDEEYWDRYRTAPKAFIPLSVGQRLWRTRYGQVTSVRLMPGQAAVDLAAAEAALKKSVPASITPASAGLTVVDVRAQNIEAASGATDFGAYFSYFSFFLMVSALLLAALFFRLSIEQRLPQIGVLRATGYPLKAIRKVWLIEGGLVALLGAVAGVALAVGWAAFMMRALTTWWVGAVGTTDLRLHVDAWSLVPGAIGGALAAAAAIALTVRRLSRDTPRGLMSGISEPAMSARASGAGPALAALGLAIALSVASAAHIIPAAGGFFGASALILIGGLLALRRWLRRPAVGSVAGTGSTGLIRLGLRNASWRPGRSLTSAGLVASAVFLIVSVDAFRKDASTEIGPSSGSGGFALFAESAIPIVHDPTSPAGRDALGLETDAAAAAMKGVEIVPFRLRPGDDASCLNLYQPKQPRVLGVPASLVAANRFRFAASTASTDEERQNPWKLLGPASPDGAVPAIVDATSLEYIFHASLGDEITIDAATPRPVRLRVVATLADSVLQGEVLISEQAFLTLYPAIAGYRVLLIGVEPATPDRIAAVTKTLEDALEPFGLDAQETSARLAAFHRVENTYLSTFQALGGLGLVLGTFGLVAVIARNVLERRRELAVLGAAGYARRDLQVVVAAEHVALVIAGLAIGTLAAAVAIAPVLIARHGALPWWSLVWLVVVAVVGTMAAWLSTRRVRRLPLVASLRSE